MKESYLKAFNAIVGFINDLWEVFGNSKKVTPLALYRRLTQHIRFTDETAILKAIEPFERFVKHYKKLIISGELAKIPRKTAIKYGNSPRARIEIEKFIYRGDAQTRSIIHQHLLTISAILSPSEETFQELEKKAQATSLKNSPEGKMISNIVDKLGTSMDGADMSNPGTAIAHLMNSGIIGELFGSMSQGVGSGEMDIGRLLGSLQTTLGALAEGSGNPALESTQPPLHRPVIEEVKDEPTADLD